ncbi:hypothetical protein Tco_1392061 [Tanacetum coccineum]
MLKTNPSHFFCASLESISAIDNTWEWVEGMETLPSCTVVLLGRKERLWHHTIAKQADTPTATALVPDPMELDEHVPVYVLDPKHPEYHAPSDDKYPMRGAHMGDEEEEEHLASTDPSTVPIVDPVLSAGDTEAFETDESAPTLRSPQTWVPFSQTRLRRATKAYQNLRSPMSASIEARIAEHVVVPIPPTSPAYDRAPLGHRVSMIHMRDDIPEEDMPHRRRFVLTAPPPGCDIAESSAA